MKFLNGFKKTANNHGPGWGSIASVAAGSLAGSALAHSTAAQFARKHPLKNSRTQKNDGYGDLALIPVVAGGIAGGNTASKLFHYLKRKRMKLVK